MNPEQKNLEKISCPLCGKEDFKILFSRKDAVLMLDEILFDVVMCIECRFFFLNPRPDLDTIKKYYPIEYYSDFENGEELLKKCEKVSRKKYKKLRNLNIRTLLDIGAKRGEFIEFVKRKNPEADVYGLDLDEKVPNIFNLNFKYMNVWEADYPAGFFDVITMWEVLEHIHNLDKTFRKIFKFLNEKGVFIFSIPNFNSVKSRFLKVEDIPRHLYFFTSDSITRILKKHGFRVRRIDFVNSIYPNTARELLVFWYKRVFLKKSLDEIVIEYNHPEKEKKTILLLLFRILDRAITIPLQFILNFLGFSSNMVIFAEKIT